MSRQITFVAYTCMDCDGASLSSFFKDLDKNSVYATENKILTGHTRL